MEDKIRKLLAVAERSTSADEAAAFLAKAQEVATQHAIDLATLQTTTKETAAQNVGSTIINLPENRSVANDASLLLASIAKANNISSLLTRSRRAKHVILYGTQTDLDTARSMYQTALTTMLRLTEEYYATKEWQEEEVWRKSRGEWGMFPQTPQGARADFRKGFVIGLDSRLSAVREETVADNHSAELVLIGAAKRAEQARDKAHPNLKSVRMPGPRGNASFSAGENAGHSFGSKHLGQRGRISAS
jgi:hypothetical protein